MSVLIHDALLKPSRPKKSGSQDAELLLPSKFSKQNLATHRTRARVRKILTSIYGIGREGRPRLRGAARARARARARALSTRDFQNSHFLLYNFQNNQGKSCLASRVWQLCKISAQSEPISMSYDRNNFRFLNPNSFL